MWANGKLHQCKYTIVANYENEPLVIKDLATVENAYMSVTNGIEGVVKELSAAGLLPDGRRLLYFDTEGQLDEVIVSNGEFVDFKIIKGEQ